MTTPKINNVTQTIETSGASISHHVAPFLFLAATHVHHLITDDDYYGTDGDPLSDIALGNTIGTLAEQYFGVNFEDDEDDYTDDSMPWSKAICKATSDEISKMLIHAVVRELTNSNIVDNSSPLYISLQEAENNLGRDYIQFFDDHDQLAARITEHLSADAVNDYQVKLWSTDDKQWTAGGVSPSLIQSISRLSVFEAFSHAGTHVIRIR